MDTKLRPDPGTTAAVTVASAAAATVASAAAATVASATASTAVIFVHGFPESKDAWRLNLARLPASVQGIAFDLPGFGDQALPDRELSHDEYLHLLTNSFAGQITRARAEGAKKIIIVAHDLGGMVAQAALAYGQTQADQLILLNSPHPTRFCELIDSDKDQNERSRYIQYILSSYFAGKERESDFKRLRFSLFDKESAVPAEIQNRYLEIWAQPKKLESMAKIYTLIEAFRLKPLPVIKTPTLMLWGEKDHALVPENFKDIEKYFDQISVNTFADHNHWTNHTLINELEAYLNV